MGGINHQKWVVYCCYTHIKAKVVKTCGVGGRTCAKDCQSDDGDGDGDGGDDHALPLKKGSQANPIFSTFLSANQEIMKFNLSILSVLNVYSGS